MQLLRAQIGTSAASRRTSVIVRAEAAVPRRTLLRSAAAALAAAAAAAAQPALAIGRDYKEALAAKEARRAKLREAAGGIKSTGKDKQVFKDSEYAVSEEAHTPNVHSRQDEGARTQVNV